MENYKELVEQIKSFLSQYEKVRYGEMVGAPWPYDHAGPLVYEEPEAVLLDYASTSITELLARAVAAEAALEREKSYDTPLPPFDDDDPGVLYCQKCGSGEYLENDDGNRNEYCGQCGQRIDWAAYDAAIEALGGAGVG